MTLYAVPPTLVEQRRNHATNPRLGTGTTGWGTSGTFDAASRNLMFGPSGAEIYGYSVARVGSMGPDLAAHYSQSLTAGTWRIGLLIRAEAATGPVMVAAASNPTLDIGRFYEAAVTADGTWRWYGFTITTTGTGTVYIGTSFAPGDTSVEADLTAVLIEPGTTVPTYAEYFHGSFLDTAAKDYSWAGTPDASQSILSVPNAASTIEPALTLAPYVARRETRTVVHQLLDEPNQRFTWRQPALPVGEFELLFLSHESAYASMSKLSARTAWALYEDTDSGTVERWFMVAGGDIEMEQSDDVPNAYIVRVPYVEIESL